MALPISVKCKSPLRLDTQAPGNGFAHENVRDAFADVEATIYMTLLIRDRAPVVWHALLLLVDKVEAECCSKTTPTRCQRWPLLTFSPALQANLPMVEIVLRAAVAPTDGQFAARVGVAMAQRHLPFQPAQAVEGRMYAGFPSRTDEARMQAFCKTD